MHPRRSWANCRGRISAVWKAFQKAAEAAGIGKLATHTMGHTYRTTMNICGDVVTDEMSQAHAKVVQMVLLKKAVNRR